MTREEFREFIELLPADAPYFLAVFGSPPRQCSSTLSERQTAAESDPAFWWNFVLSYVRAGKTLPELPWPQEILRLFRHLSDPDSCDQNLIQAEMFSLPENQRSRDLICALLLCRSITDAYIANVFRCEVEAVHLFHFLLWHVRPFLHDPQYLSELQQSTTSGLGPGPDLLRRKLLTRALEAGDPASVLAVAGISLPEGTTISPGELSEEIEREVTALTAQALAQGIENPKRNRPLFLFLRYLLGRNGEQPPGQELLFGFQLTPADLQLAFDDLNHRLALECLGPEEKNSGPAPTTGSLNPSAVQNRKDTSS